MHTVLQKESVESQVNEREEQQSDFKQTVLIVSLLSFDQQAMIHKQAQIT